MKNGPDRLTFLGWSAAPNFELREIPVAPGGERAYLESEWRDALVVLERGEIDLECLTGSRRRFRHGAVLWLMGLPLRALHNRGREPALLVAVSRRHPLPSANVARSMTPRRRESSGREPAGGGRSG